MVKRPERITENSSKMQRHCNGPWQQIAEWGPCLSYDTGQGETQSGVITEGGTHSDKGFTKNSNCSR